MQRSMGKGVSEVGVVIHYTTSASRTPVEIKVGVGSLSLLLGPSTGQRIQAGAVSIRAMYSGPQRLRSAK
jgi:hypothetical protein